MAETRPGYTDTPILPGQRWRVHDVDRPHPRPVWPGWPSTQERAGEPPSDAIVLFDGSSFDGWESVRGGPVPWRLVEGGAMEVAARTGDIRTRAEFGDCQLHLEWRAAENPQGESQGRSNSGVFLMGRYEIQVLDCYQNPTYADGTTAAIYGQFPPLVNACRRPGEWQTYDLIWIAPRFDGERLVSPAYLTLFHNGVVVHYHTALIGPTSHRKVLPYEPHPPVGPLRLQDHGDPVRFRNIWYRPLKGYDEP